MANNDPKAQFEIGFEWPVHRGGYDIDSPKPKTSASAPLSTIASGLDDPFSGRRLVPAGAEADQRAPLEYHGRLYLQFAQLAEIDEAPESPSYYDQFAIRAKEFADRFGLLVLPSQGGNSLWHWHEEAMSVRRSVELWKDDPDLFPTRLQHDQSVARVDVHITSADGRPIMRFVPPSLVQAISLQFLQAVLSGARVKACRHCGKWFEVGAGSRRSVAAFCTDRCRVLDFHRKRKESSK